jgi:hypothetical protein
VNTAPECAFPRTSTSMIGPRTASTRRPFIDLRANDQQILVPFGNQSPTDIFDFSDF